MTCTKSETSAACLTCRGYCCYRFQIFGLQPDAEGRPDWDRFIREHDPLTSEVSEIRELFVARAKEPVGRHVDVTLTCRKFDVRSGRCMIHETRPMVCRRFLCEEALRGVDPDTAARETGISHQFPCQKRRLARLDKRWQKRHQVNQEDCRDA